MTSFEWSEDRLRTLDRRFREIWKAMTGVDLQASPGPSDSANPVHGVVDIDGAWVGSVVITCGTPLAHATASRILGDEFNEGDIRDFVGELANVFGGHVKSFLPTPTGLSTPHHTLPAGSLGPRFHFKVDDDAIDVSIVPNPKVPR